MSQGKRAGHRSLSERCKRLRVESHVRPRLHPRSMHTVTRQMPSLLCGSASSVDIYSLGKSRPAPETPLGGPPPPSQHELVPVGVLGERRVLCLGGRPGCVHDLCQLPSDRCVQRAVWGEAKEEETGRSQSATPWSPPYRSSEGHGSEDALCHIPSDFQPTITTPWPAGLGATAVL